MTYNYPSSLDSYDLARVEVAKQLLRCDGAEAMRQYEDIVMTEGTPEDAVREWVSSGCQDAQQLMPYLDSAALASSWIATGLLKVFNIAGKSYSVRVARQAVPAADVDHRVSSVRPEELV